MASLVTPTKPGYDVLAEAETADGRVVKRVEARATDLGDVPDAFRLAAGEARKAHLPVARVRLSARRGGVVEVAMVDEDALAQSALLDGKTKLDVPPPPAVAAKSHEPGFDCRDCGAQPGVAHRSGCSRSCCPECGAPILGLHKPGCSGPNRPWLTPVPLAPAVETLRSALHQMAPGYGPWEIEYDLAIYVYRVSCRGPGGSTLGYKVSALELEHHRSLPALARQIIHAMEAHARGNPSAP